MKSESIPRSYRDLQLVAPFLYLAAAISGLVCFAAFTSLFSSRHSPDETFAVMLSAFATSLGCICAAGLLRLARNVATDLEVLRLAAESEWRSRNAANSQAASAD